MTALVVGYALILAGSLGVLTIFWRDRPVNRDRM